MNNLNEGNKMESYEKLVEKCGELVSEYAMHTKFANTYCNDCYKEEYPVVNGVVIK